MVSANSLTRQLFDVPAIRCASSSMCQFFDIAAHNQPNELLINQPLMDNPNDCGQRFTAAVLRHVLRCVPI